MKYTNFYKEELLFLIMSVEDCLTGNIIRHEAVVDLEKLKEFKEVHDIHIMRKSPDPAGQDYNITYIPSSIGMGVHIACRCGETKDITDYDTF